MCIIDQSPHLLPFSQIVYKTPTVCASAVMSWFVHRKWLFIWPRLFMVNDQTVEINTSKVHLKLNKVVVVNVIKPLFAVFESVCPCVEEFTCNAAKRFIMGQKMITEDKLCKLLKQKKLSL